MDTGLIKIRHQANGITRCKHLSFADKDLTKESL